MIIQDILVQVDERPTANLLAMTAAQLAARHGARLTGVFLKSDFLRLHGGPEAIGFLSPAQFDAILREQAEAVAKVEAVARAQLSTRLCGRLASLATGGQWRATGLTSLCRSPDHSDFAN